MCSTLKIAILAAVALGELAAVILVGSRMVHRDRLPVALALAASAVVTVAAIGYVLFFVVD